MLSAKREQLLQAATTARAQGGKFDAERELAEVDAKLRRLESIHEGLRIAVTLPHAEKAGTFFGKYISPYLSDIGAISSAAASGRFTMKGVGR